MVCGVGQRAQLPKLLLSTESQFPPVAVKAWTVKLKVMPVLGIIKVCGSGSAPANGFVKLIPLICLNTLAPIVTPTGTVTLSVAPEVWSLIWPMKVPAFAPAPGRFAVTSDTLTFADPVPLVEETLSQFPPSAVLVLKLQFNVPVPPLRTYRLWLGGFNPPVCNEKLI